MISTQTETQTIARTYANKHGYSDVFPFEVIGKVSATTMDVRGMKATIDPAWKPDVAAGGFVGHTLNNRDQSYTFASDPQAPQVRIRYSARLRQWRDSHGNRYALSMTPCRFHDFNF